MEKLLAHLGLPSYSLVLHDWGGAIGMGVAGRAPERVRSLVVMNTAAFRSRRLPFRIRLCRVPILGDLLVRGCNGFARAAISMAVAGRLPGEVAAGYLAPYDSWRNRIATLRFVQDIPLSPKDASWETLLEIEHRLPTFRHTPMLLLWGGRDFCFTREFFEEWRRRFPDAEHHFFPEAGHYLLEDAGQEIGPLVARFLAENS